MLREFLHKPAALVGSCMLAVVLIAALFGPWLSPYEPYARIRVEPSDLFAPPDNAHILGRDDAGKDIWSQLIYGARVSLIVGFAASLVSMGIGTTVGLVAGFYGGKVGNLLMRFVDFLMVVPDLPLMLVIIAVWGRGLFNIILVIGLLGWTYSARLVRSQTLSIKERQFILRARSIGASNGRIIIRHILPQVLPLIVAQSVLDISASILAESSLSFLGLGDPNLISWGSMLNFAMDRGAVSRQAWWFLLPPGFAILWVTLALILIGNSLEEIVNPRTRSHHLFNARRMVALVLPLPAPRYDAPVTPQAAEEIK